MDLTDILPSLEQLDDALDTLEDTLEPLSENMSDMASKLPVLDKAKLYVLMAYSIESILFCETATDGFLSKRNGANWVSQRRCV